MRNMNVSKLNRILVLALVCVFLVGSFAYFTDRVETDATIKTVVNGVDIVPDVPKDVVPDDPTKDPDDYEDPTPTDPTDDLTQWWAWLNARAMGNFNPGDKLTLDYVLRNAGSLAVDVRETFIVTSTVPLKDGAPEFRLFTGYTKAANGANTGKNVVVTEKKIDSKTYQYTVAPYTLSSTSETISGAPVSFDRDYYLVFDVAAGNNFQKAVCSVTYVVEAKQHTSPDADWAIVTTANLELDGTPVTLNGQPIKVVPAA